MALKRSKLSQIPQRNKDLAFGYVHEKEKVNKISVPEMIKYLCLVYFNPNKDEFDPDQCDDKIKIKENSMITDTNPDDIQTAFLKNVVSSGIHVWRFKCIGDWDEPGNPDLIGIYNMDYEHLMNSNEDCYFDNYSDVGEEDNIPRGHGFCSDGRLTNEYMPSEWGCDYYPDGWGKDDTIEMRLDFNKQHLKFKVNDDDYGVAFEIDATKKFKAAISVGRRETGKGGFELISYQKLH